MYLKYQAKHQLWAQDDGYSDRKCGQEHTAAACEDLSRENNHKQTNTTGMVTLMFPHTTQCTEKVDVMTKKGSCAAGQAQKAFYIKTNSVIELRLDKIQKEKKKSNKYCFEMHQG